MYFEFSDKTKAWVDRVRRFMDDQIIPAVPTYEAQQKEGSRWKVIQVVEDLKVKAKKEGLWNFFMPPSSGHPKVDDTFQFEGEQLTNMEYAPLAELMGRVGFASEVFNCSAPDTGNMEVFERYGTREQKEQWLRPLMNGEIRSAFLMTEPAVASSDATNIQCEIKRDGADYVINGRKWWSSGAGDSRCKVYIVMGKTDPDNASRHSQQSMVLVPADTKGVKILRHLPVFGYDDAPHGHMEIELKDVRVPASNVLLGEGRGFEIAQGRLGPGRIHHCMRLIGVAERALELMCRRSQTRVTFGKPIAERSVTQERIAESRIMIESARLLVLKAAYMMDTVGNKAARGEIAMIKVLAPNVACRVLDWAIQAHGGAGMAGDFPLAYLYAHSRGMRFADGPDEVHRNAVAKLELARNAAAKR